MAVGVPAAQPIVPDSESHLLAVKPPTLSATASKMHSSSSLIDDAPVSSLQANNWY